MGTFQVGQHRRVGRAWAFQDCVMPNSVGVEVQHRLVYHYGTLMGGLCRWVDPLPWNQHNVTVTFQPYSTGWGSVSDQNGMNQICRRYGWQYRRNGGVARYERIIAG